MSYKKLRVLRIVAWTLFLGWTFICVFLSQQDGAESGAVSEITTRLFLKVARMFGYHPNVQVAHAVIREFAHFFTHFTLATLAGLAFMTSFRRVGTALGWAFICSVIAAMFDEFVQLAANGRAFEVLDLGLNLGGVVVGIAFAWLLIRAVLAILKTRTKHNL